MIYLLTSNDLPTRSIKEYSENFIFSLLHTVPFIPSTTHKIKYIYDLFYHQDIDLSDEYQSDQNIEVRYHPVQTIEEGLTQISRIIEDADRCISEKDPDHQEELVFGICCDYNVNRQIVKYLNNLFSEMDQIETTGLDLYTYLRIPGISAMTRTLKNTLGTEFIYPEDPVAFGYALITAIGGLL